MTYTESKRFALNHHAGFFRVKESANNQIIPEFFSLFFEKQLREASVSEGSKTLTSKQIYSLDFDIPPYSAQQSIMQSIAPILKLKTEIEGIINKIIPVLEKNLVIHVKDNENVLLSDILEYVSRNDSLSEEGIYKRSADIAKSVEKIKVISGSIDDIYGYFPLDSGIHALRNRSCLQVVTRGRACSLRYLEKGNYATNTNSMLLVIKEKSKELIELKSENDEDVYLRFLEFYLYPYFKEFSSSADLSVFPLTEAINKIEIPLIKLNDEIYSISEQYRNLKGYLNTLNVLSDRINELFNKTIA